MLTLHVPMKLLSSKQTLTDSASHTGVCGNAFRPGCDVREFDRSLLSTFGYPFPLVLSHS